MNNQPSDLFNGTAHYYEKFRPAYPKELLNFILTFVEKKSESKLLDLGCGTGQLAIPLSQSFHEVHAIDSSLEMLSKGQEAGRSNIKWHHLSAEKMEELHQSFDAIFIGNAFHWMNREKVLHSCFNMLEPKGTLVILAGGSVWNGKKEWQKKIVEVIQKYLGTDRRAGSSTYQKDAKKHEYYLERSPLTQVTKGNYTFNYPWTIDHIIGYLYSTSFCNRALLGEKVEEFEAEITDELTKLSSTGSFIETIEVTYFVLKK
ncbi:class I SAM-dependent methyltransferase [Rossellomorea aquimaris]|uniref:class I SAM-dependent methyltransferase n=1 Tax=Rossellomorea aquimaris TaxID=189382 RepID=UPI0007D05A51|nr:class I SAM-dependent methyltransferase [Rossellomorea aquimaris]